MSIISMGPTLFYSKPGSTENFVKVDGVHAIGELRIPGRKIPPVSAIAIIRKDLLAYGRVWWRVQWKERGVVVHEVVATADDIVRGKFDEIHVMGDE